MDVHIMFTKIVGDYMISNIELIKITNNYGFNPFEKIRQYIESEIIPKYDCLTTVHISYEDECGFPAIEFYIRYNVKFSFENESKLWENVVGDIRGYCESNGLYTAYRKCCFFVTISGDAFESK